MFVTIAVLPKNPVDCKSMSLAKSLFACLCDIVCSYIKKMEHFWGAGLLYTGVNFENKHGFSPGTLCKSIVALLKEIALVSPYPLDTGRKLNVHKTFRRRPGRLMYVQFTSCVYWVRRYH